MKLSTRARYALRMMVSFAHSTDGNKLVSLSNVAKDVAVSRRYLEQLVIGLKNADLIRGKSGKGGGYALAVPADKIKIREIVESTIGPINIVECVLKPETCLKSDTCQCRVLYRLINEQIANVLGGLFLSDLANGNRMTELAAMFDTNPLRRPEGEAKDPCNSLCEKA